MLWQVSVCGKNTCKFFLWSNFIRHFPPKIYPVQGWHTKMCHSYSWANFWSLHHFGDSILAETHINETHQFAKLCESNYRKYWGETICDPVIHSTGIKKNFWCTVTPLNCMRQCVRYCCQLKHSVCGVVKCYHGSSYRYLQAHVCAPTSTILISQYFSLWAYTLSTDKSAVTIVFKCTFWKICVCCWTQFWPNPSMPFS